MVNGDGNALRSLQDARFGGFCELPMMMLFPVNLVE